MRAKLQKIANLRKERDKAKMDENWPLFAEKQRLLTQELEGLKPVFVAMGKHVKAMSQKR